MYEVQESDWRLYRVKLPNWQEAYMAKLLEKYMKLIQDDKKPASKRFWSVETCIRKDKNKPGVQVMLSRSRMFVDICSMVSDKTISLVDLEDFSAELREAVGAACCR